MEQFEAVAKRWGNSIGITIPSEIIEQENIEPQNKIQVLILKDVNKQKLLKNIFGTLKLKKDTQEIMKEIDEGYDEP